MLFKLKLNVRVLLFLFVNSFVAALILLSASFCSDLDVFIIDLATVVVAFATPLVKSAASPVNWEVTPPTVSKVPCFTSPVPITVFATPIACVAGFGNKTAPSVISSEPMPAWAAPNTLVPSPTTTAFVETSIKFELLFSWDEIRLFKLVESFLNTFSCRILLLIDFSRPAVTSFCAETEFAIDWTVADTLFSVFLSSSSWIDNVFAASFSIDFTRPWLFLFCCSTLESFLSRFEAAMFKSWVAESVCIVERTAFAKLKLGSSVFWFSWLLFWSSFFWDGLFGTKFLGFGINPWTFAPTVFATSPTTSPTTETLEIANSVVAPTAWVMFFNSFIPAFATMVPCFTALLTTLIVSLTTVNGSEAARAVVVAATPFVNSNEPWTIS